MEEELWITASRSRALQDFRREIAGRWRDEASKSLTVRYLDPHEAEDEQMLGARRQQQSSMVSGSDHLDSATSHETQAEELSCQVEEVLDLAYQEMRIAEQQLGIYHEHEAEARALMPEIENAIQLANRCCQGVAAQ